MVGAGKASAAMGLALERHWPGELSDGAEEVAGAVVTPDTLACARAAGLDPRAMLAANDAHRLFEAMGDQVTTGPTLTNVNDFRAVLFRPG